MVKLSDDALDALRAKECLRDGKTVDRHRLSALLIERLEAEHVAHSMDEVGAAQVDAGQLTMAVLGSDSKELTDLVKELAAIGADSYVQAGLTNGYMLCQGSYKLDVETSGEIKTLSFSTRFLSDDHEVIRTHVLAGKTRRTESQAKGNKRLGDLVVKRQPGMAESVQTWTANLETIVRAALGSGS
jgi:hypothetical protein